MQSCFKFLTLPKMSIDLANDLAQRLSMSDYFSDDLILCRCGCLQQKERKNVNYDLNFINYELVELLNQPTELKNYVDGGEYTFYSLSSTLLANPDKMTVAKFVEVVGWKLPQNQQQLERLFRDALENSPHRPSNSLLEPIKFFIEQLGFNVNHQFVSVSSSGQIFTIT